MRQLCILQEVVSDFLRWLKVPTHPENDSNYTVNQWVDAASKFPRWRWKSVWEHAECSIGVQYWLRYVTQSGPTNLNRHNQENASAYAPNGVVNENRPSSPIWPELLLYSAHVSIAASSTGVASMMKEEYMDSYLSTPISHNSYDCHSHA